MATVQTIKGSHKKIGASSYDVFIPFGTDGNYVDMLSGLSLERELKLGGDHGTSILENEDGSFQISEKYAPAAATVSYYRVDTNINSDADTIVQKLYWIDQNGQSSLKKTKTISIIEETNGFNIQEVLS